jgi:hypothetical protein
MPNVFKRYKGRATSSGTTIYRVPSATTTVLLGMQAANINDSDSRTLDVLFDSDTYLLKNAPIPFGSTLSFLDGKLIAESDDTIVAYSDDSDLDIILAVMEQT